LTVCFPLECQGIELLGFLGLSLAGSMCAQTTTARRIEVSAYQVRRQRGARMSSNERCQRLQQCIKIKERLERHRDRPVSEQIVLERIIGQAFEASGATLLPTMPERFVAALGSLFRKGQLIRDRRCHGGRSTGIYASW